MASMEPAQSPRDRARWMSLLAKAPAPTLTRAVAQLGSLPEYVWLRRPEVGMAMVRGRIGGSGALFNVGEMTVTRCALKLAGGQMGVAYVAGRDTRHAQWAALCDAMLQTEAAPHVEQVVLKPIADALAARAAAIRTQAEATRVDFVTMVRGEDK